MSVKNPERIWKGFDRVYVLPGNVLVLNYHHDGESHWATETHLRERVESILDGNKPEGEWGSRMEAMAVIPWFPEASRLTAEADNQRWDSRPKSARAMQALHAVIAASPVAPMNAETWLCKQAEKHGRR